MCRLMLTMCRQCVAWWWQCVGQCVDNVSEFEHFARFSLISCFSELPQLFKKPTTTTTPGKIQKILDSFDILCGDLLLQYIKSRWRNVFVTTKCLVFRFLGCCIFKLRHQCFPCGVKKMCASRESNPGHKHGRLVCYRYTTGALASPTHFLAPRS